MAGLTGQWALDWAHESAKTIHEHEAELTHLDRDIGDGDHGSNMDRGFTAVVGKLDGTAAASGQTPADILKTVATTLISTVGGAAGPLFGTAFLKGSIAVKGLDELDGPAVAAFLTAARDGVVARGKAESGDKTMVDALTPAVDAADAAVAAGTDAVGVLEAAAAAAQEGAVATEPLIAHKGRASYLGERAIGHRDPGAQSTAYLLAAAVAAAKGAQE